MTGEELKAIIAERIERDPRLRKIRAKTAKGKATKADSFQYSRICSEIMSEELAKAVLDLDDREGICAALLRGNYEEIMQTADAIQRSIDEKQGISRIRSLTRPCRMRRSCGAHGRRRR